MVAMRDRVRRQRTSSSQFAGGRFVRAWLLCLFFAASLLSAFGQATPDAQRPTNQAEPKPTNLLRPGTNRLPDANDIMTMRQEKVAKAKFEAANVERKRQLDEDTQALLKLAADVNGDLDTTGHKPSPELLRKMEEIERLAHNVQVKMKLTMTAPF